jgi:hypothetical protein
MGCVDQATALIGNVLNLTVGESRNDCVQTEPSGWPTESNGVSRPFLGQDGLRPIEVPRLQDPLHSEETAFPPAIRIRSQFDAGAGFQRIKHSGLQHLGH